MTIGKLCLYAADLNLQWTAVLALGCEFGRAAEGIF
jgi:hypothetical protein